MTSPDFFGQQSDPARKNLDTKIAPGTTKLRRPPSTPSTPSTLRTLRTLRTLITQIRRRTSPANRAANTAANGMAMATMRPP